MEILEKKLCKNCGSVVTHKGKGVFCSKKCEGEFKHREWFNYVTRKRDKQ